MTTKTTTRKAADAGVQDLMDLATGKRKPAAVRRPAAKQTAPAKKAPAKPKATEAPASKPLTRTELLARMEELGYTGPTSFTATVLRDVVEWMEAGSPEGNESIPLGVMFTIHPHLKPQPKAKAKRLSAGYLAALADVLAVLDNSGDVRTFVTEGLATGEASA
ncbi:hypothetical protein ACIRN4_23810 [Pimelobacter simplex]|uniref:hypothetical protein n=1 Tax=Nocardioides simplex TaxID=2045 RepID=UPI00381100F7